MSNKKVFVVVQIISGERVLKKWFGGNVNQDTPLVDLFAEFASGKFVLIRSFYKSHLYVPIKVNPTSNIPQEI